MYFANVRPCYKFALVGKCTLVYAFSRCDGAAQIGFWDGQSVTKNVQFGFKATTFYPPAQTFNHSLAFKRFLEKWWTLKEMMTTALS